MLRTAAVFLLLACASCAKPVDYSGLTDDEVRQLWYAEQARDAYLMNAGNVAGNLALIQYGAAMTQPYVPVYRQPITCNRNGFSTTCY